MFDDPTSDAADSPGQASFPPAQREVDSQTLMQGDREIIIRHAGQAYRLSVTRNGKLILRK